LSNTIYWLVIPNFVALDLCGCGCVFDLNQHRKGGRMRKAR